MSGATIAYVNGIGPENAGKRTLMLGKVMELRANAARFPFKAPSLDEKVRVYPHNDMPISEMKSERLIISLMEGKTEYHEPLSPERYVAMLVQLFKLHSNGQKDAIKGGLELRDLTMGSFLEKHVKPRLLEIAMKMELETVARAEMVEGRLSATVPSATEFATPDFLKEMRRISNPEAVKKFFEKGPGFLGF
jgi:hypothetical protein